MPVAINASSIQFATTLTFGRLQRVFLASRSGQGGASSALADIGSHWSDLAQHISGSRIVSVVAEMTAVISTRYVAYGSQEAFNKRQTESRTPVSVTGEDLASVLLRFENGAKGCLSVGQVMQGHKNGLMIEVDDLEHFLSSYIRKDEWRIE